MKAFQHINAILILAIVVGVPVAATTRPPHEPFSIGRALARAGIAAAVLLVLLAGNCVLSRVFARHREDKTRA
mgnify:CR=1 FL=1